MPFFSLEPSFPIKRYVFRMWLFSFFFPVLTVVAAVALAFSLGAPDFPDFPRGGPKPHSGTFRDAALYFVMGVAYSPVVETFFLAFTILLVSRLRWSRNSTALVSAGAFAVWHSLSWAPWGLLIFWPFYLMSRIYMAWRPTGFWRAWSVVALTHAAYNLVPALAGIASR